MPRAMRPSRRAHVRATCSPTKTGQRESCNLLYRASTSVGSRRDQARPRRDPLSLPPPSSRPGAAATGLPERARERSRRATDCGGSQKAVARIREVARRVRVARGGRPAAAARPGGGRAPTKPMGGTPGVGLEVRAPERVAAWAVGWRRVRRDQRASSVGRTNSRCGVRRESTGASSISYDARG